MRIILFIILNFSFLIANAQIKPKQLENAADPSYILISEAGGRYDSAHINDIITFDTIIGRDRVIDGHKLVATVDHQADTVRYFVSGLTTVQSGTDNQELNIDYNTNFLSLERGSYVDLTLYRNGQPLDTFAIVSDSLRISITNDQLPYFAVDLSPYLDNTDDQVIDTFTIVSNVLRLSVERDGEAFKSVDLSAYLDNTDDQTVDTFEIVSNVLRLSVEGDGEAFKSVSLAGYLDNTDTQDLSLSDNTLTLTNGGSVDLSAYLDNTVLTEEQVEDYVGGMLGGAETGISVAYNDAGNNITFTTTDQSNENELQDFDIAQLSGTDLQLSLTQDATTWTIPLASLTGGGDNIYSANGTLNSNRIVSTVGYNMDIYSGNNDNLFYLSTGANYETTLKLSESTTSNWGGYLHYDGLNNYMDIGTNFGNTVPAIRINRNSSTVQLVGYTGTAKDGTASKNLSVDANGNVITTANPTTSTFTGGIFYGKWSQDFHSGTSVEKKSFSSVLENGNLTNSTAARIQCNEAGYVKIDAVGSIINTSGSFNIDGTLWIYKNGSIVSEEVPDRVYVGDIAIWSTTYIGSCDGNDYYEVAYGATTSGTWTSSWGQVTAILIE